jgi:hypothetical protein
MGRVVHLHIGAPKTGTTFLQERLALNAATLADHGVHFPGGPLGLDPVYTHFKAALDLMGEDWGGPTGHADGYWDILMRRVRRAQGDVVVSHEILAAAPRKAIDRAMADLRDCEVHIVFSARDIARQLPAVWQESVKLGRRWTFKRFLAVAQERGDMEFWRSQSIPGVLGRWSAGLEPSQVHLVTVPQPDGAPDVLWERFCRTFGIDPAWAPLRDDRVNESMGIAETTLIRQLNRRLHDQGLDRHQHSRLVKQILVQEHLASRQGQKATLPPALYPWAAEVAEGWIEWAEGSGIHIVGDVDDLRPVPPPQGHKWVNPDRPPHRDLVEAALDGLVAMTTEAANRPDPSEQISAKVGRAAKRLRS